jgi:hypothetical protein
MACTEAGLCYNYHEVKKDAAMLPESTKTVFELITDFLASEPSPEAIIAYRLPQSLEERAHALLDLNSEGKLSFDEELEMYDFMRADDMMSLLKTKTRLKLAGKLHGD